MYEALLCIYQFTTNVPLWWENKVAASSVSPLQHLWTFTGIQRTVYKLSSLPLGLLVAGNGRCEPEALSLLNLAPVSCCKNKRKAVKWILGLISRLYLYDTCLWLSNVRWCSVPFFWSRWYTNRDQPTQFVACEINCGPQIILAPLAKNVDIVFNTVFNYGYHPKRSSLKSTFL